MATASVEARAIETAEERAETAGREEEEQLMRADTPRHAWATHGVLEPRRT